MKFDVDIYSGGARGSHQVKTTECIPFLHVGPVQMHPEELCGIMTGFAPAGLEMFASVSLIFMFFSSSVKLVSKVLFIVFLL